MDVKSVNNANLYAYSQTSDKKVKQEQEEAKKTSLKEDRLEISGKKDLEAINDKVESGVYNDPAVLREVALKLSRELSPDELAEWNG